MSEKVAYLGPAGTFTEQALWQFADTGVLGDRDVIEPVPVKSPAEALDAVANGSAGFAVVAIENSVDGPVTHTFDALAAHPGVHIYGETDVSIAFAIMVRPGFALSDARSFSTHPVARPQVAGWLRENLAGVEDIPASSNAAAAQAVAEGRVDVAAAPLRAADVYGLEVVAREVADVAGARTRFIVVGPAHVPPARTGNDRTGVVFTLPNTPGSLVGALMEFGSRGVDLTRLESRPTRTGLGTYRFHADLAGHITDAPIAEALAALHRRCDEVQFLGSWPAVSGNAVAVPKQWEESRRWVESLTGEYTQG
ncbi:prephenate dehydratase [Corynebacterium aquilae]|uniref:Prephenate dehydratase n=1 Tax=Corynebacterium aquilae DSM 44791 TaxID=1431546 RepID=A0A1L7CIF5_9CORY|nr:prephenate dehydratase [Corynebacterium aquilae]APT85646.1 prephenate dehydratase [Corynebacterium aquilae DSM 44791]